MPNPLVRLGQSITSKPVPERPQPVTPVMDNPAGHNNPWRGIQDHGVAPNNEPEAPGTLLDTKAGIHYQEPKPEIDPIPVLVVNEYGREMRKWRPFRSFAMIANSTQLIGRNMARSSLYIRNISDTVSIWVSPEPNITIGLNAFEIEPNTDLTINTQDDVWVLAGTGATDPVPIQAIENYSIEV